MPDYVKQLTGKNPQEFEFAAAHIINDCDLEVFSELVKKGNFLFDFIKRNVNQRLLDATTKENYKNLLSFFKIYSADFEDFIVKGLVKFADEDLTDTMLNLLENGTNEEKAYCAKYFSYINDTLSIDLLRKDSYSGFSPLALNCAEALSKLNDEFSYNLAIEKLNSQDDFEQLSAAKFLVAYGNKKALDELFKVMKKSSMPEHIASEIPYLENFMELLSTNYKDDTILAVNHILNGLGEIVSLSQVFDFQLYDIFEHLIDSGNNSKSALILLSAKYRFEQLTENNEYLFDESKEVKTEVLDITNFLNTQSEEFWAIQEDLFVNELDESSPFVFSALELIQELKIYEDEKLKNLLNSSNQTIILKTLEVIKSFNKLGEIDKDSVLAKLTDENIKAVAESLFN